jgi:transposase-like protein
MPGVCRPNPLRVDRDRGRGGVHALVDAARDLVAGEEPVLGHEPLGLRPRDRHQRDGGAAGRELGDRPRGVAADEEEGVHRPVPHLLGRLVRLEVLGPDVALCEAVGAQDQPRVDQRARARLVERDALAPEVGDARDARVLAHHEVDALRVEVGDRAQLLDLGLALEDPRSGERPVGDVGLAEPALEGIYIPDSSGGSCQVPPVSKDAPFPSTLMDAVTYFADPDRCHDYMRSIKWPDGRVTCPACGRDEIGEIKGRRMFQCRTKGCRKQLSVKVGTTFEDSPLPLQKWLVAVWSITNAKNGISSCELARAVGVTQKSAWFMLHRIRLAMKTGTFIRIKGEIEADIMAEPCALAICVIFSNFSGQPSMML